MFPTLLYPLLSFIPVGCSRSWSRFGAGGRKPAACARPAARSSSAPPGELVRKRKEDIDDRILDTMVWVLGFPSVLAACYLSFSHKSAGPPSMAWALRWWRPSPPTSGFWCG